MTIDQSQYFRKQTAYSKDIAVGASKCQMQALRSPSRVFFLKLKLLQMFMKSLLLDWGDGEGRSSGTARRDDRDLPYDMCLMEKGLQATARALSEEAYLRGNRTQILGIFLKMTKKLIKP